MGNTLKELEEMDNSDGNPYLSESEYDTLHAIRELRNYWCHQCYIDWVYIDNDYNRTRQLQKILNRLENELNRVRKPQALSKD